MVVLIISLIVKCFNCMKLIIIIIKNKKCQSYQRIANGFHQNLFPTRPEMHLRSMIKELKLLALLNEMVVSNALQN